MKQPYFSIIIPSYNRSHLLAGVLESALAQTYADYEVVLVDDGSSDNTRDVVSSFQSERIRYVFQENRERAAARNKGAGFAKGRYLTFCDSDDKLYPCYLEEAARLIRENGELPWMHLGYEIIRSNRPVLKMDADCKDFVSLLAKGNPLSCLGIFVRNDIFKENQFNESRQMSGSEDWELWLRMSARYKIVYSTRTCAALISHGERSVVQTSELKLQLRKYLSIGYALDDEQTLKVYGPLKHVMHAYFNTYIALHLTLEGKSLAAVKYIFKALFEYPRSLFSRRMVAIMRFFFMNLIPRKAVNT